VTPLGRVAPWVYSVLAFRVSGRVWESQHTFGNGLPMHIVGHWQGVQIAGRVSAVRLSVFHFWTFSIQYRRFGESGFGRPISAGFFTNSEAKQKVVSANLEAGLVEINILEQASSLGRQTTISIVSLTSALQEHLCGFYERSTRFSTWRSGVSSRGMRRSNDWDYKCTRKSWLKSCARAARIRCWSALRRHWGLAVWEPRQLLEGYEGRREQWRRFREVSPPLYIPTSFLHSV
jgi:hypothetical protein